MGEAHCFVYGTLMYAEVLQALIKRAPRSHRALIRGFSRHSIRGQVFPGTIKSSPDSTVQGLVLFDLTPQELEVFDEFEGDEYVKVDVQPELMLPGSSGGGEVVEGCSVYLWRDDLAPLLYGDWDAEAFRKAHLESYVKMCGRFAEQFQEDKKPDSRPYGFL